MMRKICRSIHAAPGEAVDVEGGGANEEEKEKGLDLNGVVEKAEVMFRIQMEHVLIVFSRWVSLTGRLACRPFSPKKQLSSRKPTVRISLPLTISG